IRKMERRIIPQLDAIIYVSRWAREQVWRWLPEAAQVPHAIIHNFVKSAGTPSAQPPLGDLVTVGALQATKRHQFLIEALAAAKGMGHVLTLDIYGDGPLRPRLEQSARALGLEGQVRFKGFRPDVRKFLAGYRLYVHACAVETGPIAIIEALAAGLPVVAPNVGGIPELYDDGIEGRYCSVDNSAEMAHNIVEVLADEATRRRYAAAASERFQSNFDVEVVAPRLLSFLFTHPARPVASVEDLTVPGLQVP
ncbi:MAG TPA: glycosyltransferase, partial [Acidimicrobiales bacterium]|nr:glycosyltransferase [Acidimicrobiales bacterium]